MDWDSLNAKTQRRQDARKRNIAPLRPGDLALKEETQRRKGAESQGDLPDGFRETPLGPLPETWEVVRLDGVASLSRGISWRKSEESRDGVPVIAIPNVHNGRVGFDVRYRINRRISPNKRLNNNDILIVGSSGSVHNVGRTAIVKDLPFPNATFASFLMKVAPTGRIDRGYLYFLLGSPMIDFAACSKRAADGKFNLQVGALSAHLIACPPLPEQRAIAQALRTAQQAREATERVIAAMRELKRSLMRHLFTYGPVPVAQADRVELREMEIGAMPAQWGIVALDEVQTTTQYGLSVRGEQQGQYRILRMNNLLDGRIDTSSLQFVDLSESDFQKFRLRRGDILFNRTNSYELVGKTALFDLDDDFVFASYLIRVVTDSARCAPAFLNYYLNSGTTQARLKTLASRGVSQSNINASKLRGFAIPLPPMKEQREIARILTTVDAKIAAEEARREALDAFFHTLLHHLMTGKIRTQGRQDAKTQGTEV